MEKINVAELLKDCPQGMELDCTIYNDVTLKNVDCSCYPIQVQTPEGNMPLSQYGCMSLSEHAKCVIFPKGKTTWEGFIPFYQFKDGDILYIDTSDNKDGEDHYKYVFIFKKMDGHKVIAHCYTTADDYFKPRKVYLTDNNKYPIRFATEDEKKKLFDAIRKNGYKWDSESKTLKKIEPRFKVGDRIKCAYNNNQYDIKELTNTHYILVEVKTKFKYNEPIINDKDWVLVHDKFDINTLKTFDQVLVREADCDIWLPKLFSHCETDLEMEYYIFVDIDNMGYYQCIPYEGNEHLNRKADNCDRFYRVWEK